MLRDCHTARCFDSLNLLLVLFDLVWALEKLIIPDFFGSFISSIVSLKFVPDVAQRGGDWESSADPARISPFCPGALLISVFIRASINLANEPFYNHPGEREAYCSSM